MRVTLKKILLVNKNASNYLIRLDRLHLKIRRKSIDIESKGYTLIEGGEGPTYLTKTAYGR